MLKQLTKCVDLLIGQKGKIMNNSYKPFSITIKYKEPKIIDNNKFVTHGYLEYTGMNIEKIAGVKFLVIFREYSNKREAIHIRFDEIDSFTITYQKD